MNKKIESMKRNKHVSLLMTAEEREFFKKQAEARGLGLANFFRQAAYRSISAENKA